MDVNGSPLSAGRSARTLLGRSVATLIALAAVLLGCWLLYGHEAGQIARSETARETLRVTLLSKLSESELRPVADDLRLLADGDGLRSYLVTGSPDSLGAAIRRAKFMSEHKPAYDQIRYIDQDGQELVRINQGGVVVETPQ